MRKDATPQTDSEGYALNPDGTRTTDNFDPSTGMVTSKSKGPGSPPSGPWGTLDRGAFKMPPLTSSNVTTTRGDTNVTHNPTFNISGPDMAAAMSAARVTASRGTQDLLRNVQGAEQ